MKQDQIVDSIVIDGNNNNNNIPREIKKKMKEIE